MSISVSIRIGIGIAIGIARLPLVEPAFDSDPDPDSDCFLVPMVLRGNAYRAWFYHAQHPFANIDPVAAFKNGLPE